MITSISLNSPGKSAQSLITNTLFQRKVKKPHLSKRNSFTLIIFLYLILNTKCVMAKETNPSSDVLNLYDYFINFFQIIGFPTIDVIFHCIKFHKPLYDYIRHLK